MEKCLGYNLESELGVFWVSLSMPMPISGILVTLLVRLQLSSQVRFSIQNLKNESCI